jgi:hypothetical protein
MSARHGLSRPTLTRRAFLALSATLVLGSGARQTGASAEAAPPAPRVGLQAGHWQIADLPEDQARLRDQTGGSGGGYREVDVNLAVGQATAALLMAQGVAVDILPATVPRGYRADAFVAIHCDASTDFEAHGYKLARYRESLIGDRDDLLIASLSEVYGPALGLPLDEGITRAMTGYYVYNRRRYESTIDPRTPAAIFELGFLTNAGDRALLVDQQERIAEALAVGVLRFLERDRPVREALAAMHRDLSPLVP